MSVGHLTREEFAEVNRADQGRPSIACLLFRSSCRATDNFNEGDVMIAFKYQKDDSGSNMGMGLERASLE